MKNTFKDYFNKTKNKEPSNFIRSLSTKVEFEENKSTEELIELFKRNLKHLEANKNRSFDTRSDEPSNLFELGYLLLSKMKNKCGICLTDCGISEHQNHFALNPIPSIHYYSHTFDDELLPNKTTGAGSIVFETSPIIYPNLSSYPSQFPRQVLSSPDLAKIVSILARERVTHISFRGGIPERFSVPIFETIKNLRKINIPEVDQKLLSLKGDLLVNFPKGEIPKFNGMPNVPISVRSRGFVSPILHEILQSVVDLWEIEINLFHNKCASKKYFINHFEDLMIENIKTLSQGPTDLIVQLIIDPKHFECCIKRFISRLEKEKLKPEIRFDMRNVPKESLIREEVDEMVQTAENSSYSASYVNDWISKYYW